MFTTFNLSLLADQTVKGELHMKQIKGINILKQNKGVALIWVLIVFVVLTILAASVAFLSRQNIFETAKQEERLQTYYIALAGIDLTYAALMELNGENISRKIDADIINRVKDVPKMEPIVIKTGEEEEEKERGTATVTIDMIETTEKNNVKVNWLRITSVGQLKGKKTKISSVMRINKDNYNQIIRER